MSEDQGAYWMEVMMGDSGANKAGGWKMVNESVRESVDSRWRYGSKELSMTVLSRDLN
jgi:hypothetical protein